MSQQSVAQSKLVPDRYAATRLKWRQRCHACRRPPPVALVPDLLGAHAGSLADAIKTQQFVHQGRITLLVILELSRGYARSIAYIHRQNLIHGDIKPENMLLEKRNNGSGYVTLICDLGCTQRDNNGLNPGGGFTDRYMAPECIEAVVPLKSKSSDVFAFGNVLAEFVNQDLLRPPQAGSNEQQAPGQQHSPLDARAAHLEARHWCYSLSRCAASACCEKMILHRHVHS